MLPRKLRLSRRGFGSMGRTMRVTSPHFSVGYNTHAKQGGATVVVPKKAVPSAVGRNRMKRRIRPLLTPFAEKGGIIIVYVRPGIAGIPFSELRKELNTLLATIS